MMKPRPLPRRRTRRGGNLIEFVLTFPIFWIILVALIDFGWLFAHQVALDHAVNIGCRAGALVDPGDDYVYFADIVEEVEQIMLEAVAHSPSGECDEADCSVLVTEQGLPPSRSIRCVAQRDFRPLLGVVTTERTLHGGAIALMEWQRW